VVISQESGTNRGHEHGRPSGPGRLSSQFIRLATALVWQSDGDIYSHHADLGVSLSDGQELADRATEVHIGGPCFYGDSDPPPAAHVSSQLSTFTHGTLLAADQLSRRCRAMSGKPAAPVRTDKPE
jgi:hypothetical protein